MATVKKVFDPRMSREEYRVMIVSQITDTERALVKLKEEVAAMRNTLRGQESLLKMLDDGQLDAMFPSNAAEALLGKE